MKKLQNDFTTPEQSKRLLESGVPAWTANIMFDKNRGRYELIETEDESWAETQRTLFYNGGAHPHWTVGRLIEIIGICAGMECVDFETLAWTEGIWSEKLIKLIEDLAKYYKLDFSKLED